jgi:hypothetical protein
LPETRKVLGQSAPSATTLTDLYTVPASTQVVGSALVICNRGATSTTFRVAVSPAGAAIANAHYQFYDVSVPANDTLIVVIGLTLGATDVVRVYATAAQLSFSLYGVEIT